LDEDDGFAEGSVEGFALPCLPFEEEAPSSACEADGRGVAFVAPLPAWCPDDVVDGVALAVDDASA
jgi:hypothetical protein